MKPATRLILVTLVFLIAGCAQLRMQERSQDDYWIKPGQGRASSKAVSLLYYADYLHNLSAADYTQEVEHARLLSAKEKNDFRQLQYVVALSAPGGDTRKAQLALETLLNESRMQDPELAALAQLLNADIAERRRLELGSRRAEAGAKRADELEKKMEALKNIEKSLIQRDQRTPGGSPGTEEKP